MSDPGTFQQIATHLALAVAPLREATRDVESFRQFMRRLGWAPTNLPASYQNLGNAAANALAALEALSDDATIQEVLDLIENVGDVHRAIKNLGDAPAGVDAAALLAEIGETLFEFLLVEYLASVQPDVYRALEMLDVIVHEHHEESATRPAYVRTRLRYAEIPRVLTDPLSIPQRVYGWGDMDLDFELLAEHLLYVFDALGLNAEIAPVPRALGRAFQSGAPETIGKSLDWQVGIAFFETSILGKPVHVGLRILEAPSEGSAPAGIIVQPDVPNGIAASMPITASTSFELRAGTDLADLFGVLLRPQGIEVRYPFSPGNTLPSAGFGASVVFSPAERAVLLGKAGKTRLDLAGARAGLIIEYTSGELEARVDAAVRDLAIVVSTADIDGFLGELCGGRDLVVPVQFGLEWSNRSGFSFTGGLGIQVSVYPHLELGPILIDRLDLAVAAALGASGPPSLDVSAGVALSGELGPLAFSTEGIGVELKFLFTDGNAGPFDLAFGFKPPTSLGIVIDAGPVTGGGFLAFDHPRGRYAGILQLAIYEIAITAIGLLDTKSEAGENLPAPGFSFLIIVCVEFTPIQLGFGFTLNGVGGLAGIHRRVVTEALQAGLRAGTLDHILFPQDPVRNAPQIISDLRAVFPVAVGRFVFGPMAKLGWGTPSIITAELGIILELPDPYRLVIIGQGAALLPEDAPIVQIHVDVLGVIDFALETLAIDAAIRDSYVGAFALSGDMAMRLKWGGRPNFALSVGGLNPGFTPPPNFPTLRRIMVSLGLGDNPRISIQGYMAVTSNSVQFGALAELYAEAAGFNVYGHLGFDALVIFDPFYFRFDFRAGFALRRGSSRIAGITVSGMLTGPSPFYVKGRGCLSLLFFDICVPFEATFGNRRSVELPEKSPLAELQAAMADARNWSPALPERLFNGVSIRAPTDTTLLLHDPMGRTSFRQKVIPLNKTLERFGEFAITGPNRFDVTAVRVGDEGAAVDLVEDFMAPALSENLSDKEKVSRDSYELEVVGVEVGSAHAELGPGRTRVVEYEQRIVETPWRVRVLHVLYLMPRVYQLASSFAGSKALSLVNRGGRRRFASLAPQESAVRLEDETWTVAEAATLGVASGFGAAMTKGQAMRAYKSHIRTHPGDAARLEVVSSFEMEDAA